MNRDSVLETEKKSSFAPRITAAICFCLLAAMAVGAAIAYLADTDRAKNALSIGGNRVEIVEQFMPPQEMTPGISFAKDVKVTNTGTVDCYVRVFAAFSDSDMGDYCSVDWNTADWVKEADGYWYNTTSIAPGETTSSLFTTITLSDTIPDVSIKDFDMIVYAESFQSEGYPDYPTAWTDYKRNKPAPLTSSSPSVEAPILELGMQFNEHIPSEAIAVVFTDEVAPEDVALIDVSEAQDGSIVAWEEYVESSSPLVVALSEEPILTLPSLSAGQEDLFPFLDGIVLFVSTQQSGIPVMANEDCYGMFRSRSSLTSIDFTMLDTSNAFAMGAMFYGCSGLTALDLSNFNTSNVTDMSLMFCDCAGLISLDLSNFETSKVTNMSWMFEYCESLTSLDVSGWNTSNVTYMSRMFDYCESLTSLDVSGFDTSNVTDMSWMFRFCRGLTSLDVSGFDTANVTDMNSMFYDCRGVTSLDVSHFVTAKVTDMSSMFFMCPGLTSLDLSGFDTANVTNMSIMFCNCTGLISLDLSNFETSKATDMRYMFEVCSSLDSITLGSGWDTSNVTDMSYMFNFCSALTLDCRGWNVNAVTQCDNFNLDAPGVTSPYFIIDQVTT